MQTGEPPDKRQKRAVARPGVPQPTRKSAFVVPNRPSPPERPPDKDGHFVFELGDNLTSRCELLCLQSRLVCKSRAARPSGGQVVVLAGVVELKSQTPICCATDKILSKMGEGTFGRVLECWDRKNKDYCAIKVVRAIRKYRDAAMIEVSCCSASCHEADSLTSRVPDPKHPIEK
jgi:hypothetical protein